MGFSPEIRKLGTLIYRPGGAFWGMVYPLHIRQQYKELRSLCLACNEMEALALLTEQYHVAMKRALTAIN